VQTGLGRTGKLLACDHETVKPDLLVLGKVEVTYLLRTVCYRWIQKRIPSHSDFVELPDTICQQCNLWGHKGRLTYKKCLKQVFQILYSVTHGSFLPPRFVCGPEAKGSCGWGKSVPHETLVE